MRKIIHINYQPLTKSYYQNNYISKCVSNQVEVEYWDLSKLYFPQIEFNEVGDLEIQVKRIQTFKELKLQLECNTSAKSFYVTNITYEFRVLQLFWILNFYNCKLIFFARGMYPMPSKAATSKIFQLIFKLKLSQITLGIKNRAALFLKKFKIIKPYDVVFRAGSEGGLTIGYGSGVDLKNAIITEINYFDYDKYLFAFNEMAPPLIKEKYCVFMDQYLAFHPDVAICGLQNVDAEIYYQDLNAYFEYIEKTYDVKVVIAAHPKAISYETNNPFDGRKIIFDKTCELVQHSLFVLTHHSTAISFPILFKKPIVFLNSMELKIKMPDLWDLTVFLADLLKSDLINFDCKASYNSLKLIVDSNIYDMYKYKYLTSQMSEQRYSEDIFMETISII